MENSKEFIGSGILELYVLQQTTPEETREVELAAEKDPSIKKEILEIELSLEKYAMAHAVAPNPIIKPFLLATIDYSDRIVNGEQPSSVPLLTENSTPADYESWINRADMNLPEDFDQVYAKILSSTPEATTALVWITEMAPQEVHDDEYENFLVLEGTCTITIEDQIHNLVPGDYLAIPLHKRHHVTITSEIPCKLILQRVAA
ncbi:MAG TPA: cupin domain-containing protein [Pedobacter sp.]|jgi:mannose-6-phosphate isomerase-like protein (cupin superfamily)